MARFEDNIMGLIPQDEWLNMDFRVNRPNDPIDGLFGDEKTDNLVAKWQSIATEYQIPVMAQFHGFDTEAQTTFRVPVDNHNIEKGLIKVKINQTERMRALLHAGVQNDQMYDYVINDGIRLADQVVTRTKVAKNELMAYGKITIKENNLDLTVDYGVPAENTAFTFDFSDGADIGEQIQHILDVATDKGVTINGLVTSKKNITKMRKHPSVQIAINGAYSVGALVSMSALEAYLSEEFGIDKLISNDLTYGASQSIGVDGRPSIVTKKYFPEDKMSFFSTNPGGKMGIGLWGNPPEVDAGQFMKVAQSGKSPYVYVSQWMEKDPAVLWTKASSLFIPVLYNPNSLFIATVTDADTLPDITVKPVAQDGTQYGVSVANIQTADTAVLGNKEMTGKSKWLASGNNITNYWGAGNFLAVDFTVPNDDWSVFTSVLVGLEPSAGSGYAQLIGEDDKSATFKVADPKNQKLVIIATDGKHTDKQTIDLSGVTLQNAGA